MYFFKIIIFFIKNYQNFQKNYKKLKTNIKINLILSFSVRQKIFFLLKKFVFKNLFIFILL